VNEADAAKAGQRVASCETVAKLAGDLLDRPRTLNRVVQ
jgi:hypothetical protein